MVEEASTYPVGLRLVGRRVLVVGAGQVAQRRLPGLLAAGALVTVVSPSCTPTVEGMSQAGEVTWVARGFVPSDVDGIWYAIAATDSSDVNKQVQDHCEAQRIFCVRSDDASASTAVTPAVGSHGQLTIAVQAKSLSQRDPRLSASARDAILEALHEGSINPRADRPEPGVVLVGGGPGDPDLITVAGRRELQGADVVIADRLAPQSLLGELPASVELIDVAKLPRGRSAQQQEINRLIVDRAAAGRRVVRFKGGDSFVFGRGYEEIQACQEAGISVTVIPGISSPLAVPALAGIPITHRGVTHDFTVVSGHLPPGHSESLVNWAALAAMSGTLVLMMAVENAEAITSALISHGRDAGTPAAIVTDGSLNSQRSVVTTLAGVPGMITEQRIRPPAIIVIGNVVGLSDGQSD